MVLDCIRSTISEFHMIHPYERVLVGVSGGADSMALLHILKRLQKEMNFELFTAHVEHGIRGKTSQEDARFVQKICRDWEIPFYGKSIPVIRMAEERKLTLEQAGRLARYEYFDEVLSLIEGHKIAVAHHMDDQAETLLLHLMRGSGLKGAGGMLPVRDDRVIRPLIRVNRSQILNYCARYDVPYHTDVTNMDMTYTRNRIRLELIPYLAEHFNSDIVAALARSADIFRQDEECLSKESMEVFEQLVQKTENGLLMKVKEFQQIHIAYQKRIIRQIYEHLTGSLMDLEYKHVNEILHMADEGRVGSTVVAPNHMEVRKGYENMVFTLTNTEPSDFCYKVQVPGSTIIPELNGVLRCEVLSDISQDKMTAHSPFVQYFDAKYWNGDIVIRTRKPGDRVHPLGSPGTRKLKEFLIDRKVDRWERDKIPLIVKEQNILWVIGYAISEKAKITNETKRVLRVEFIKKCTSF